MIVCAMAGRVENLAGSAQGMREEAFKAVRRRGFFGFLSTVDSVRFWANPKMKDKGYDGRLKPISS